MAYQIPVFKELTRKFGAELHVVHWDKNKLTPYSPPEIQNVTYYNRSNFSTVELKKFGKDLDCNLVYVSGWMDKGYIIVAQALKKKNIPIVAGSDTQWKGSFKQKVGSLLFPLFLKKTFNYIWVAGPSQFEYAKRLGFKNNEIIFNTLSADTNLFQLGAEYLTLKKIKYPKNFLYVGNFRTIKGTDILIEAYRRYRSELEGDWGLICVGNGELDYLLADEVDITKFDFVDQERLLEISKEAGVFILPSRFDQWGLVVHEFAAAGLPLLLSDHVGASSTFLIEGFNGFNFRSKSIQHLSEMMSKISKTPANELLKMGMNSYNISQRITPDIVAASLISVLHK